MKFTKKIAFSVMLIAGISSANAQKFEGLAKTPPMGWNSWNKFACNVSEQLIKETADAMVSSGMKDAGYEYVVIDDCWQVKRDSLGFIVADPDRFPSGIKALADYIHSKGLKFGIYSCAGAQTCGGRPASRGHEYQDALSYAKWGVDYLKYDWCFTENLNAKGAYTTMRDALYSAGRPIVFSLCEWGDNKPWLWADKVGHLWRTTGDIYNCFDCVKDHGTWKSWGVMQILDKQEGLRQYAGPGHWNDPDMMQVGNGMPVNQERAHFTMWAMLAAPLISGNDLRNMSSETLNVLTNKEVIEINQDTLGIQGFKYAVKDSVETWLKPLKNNEWALVYLNRSKSQKSISVDWKNFRVNDEFSGRLFDTTTKDIFIVRDLWLKKVIGDTRKTLQATIAGEDVLCLKISKKPVKKQK
ncbi:MAG TPA: glycoside hydrolase family 27 protein [Paludibacter sp.]|nr:glycoside hydrolase family 27 protein [Paludibacter sp.]